MGEHDGLSQLNPPENTNTQQESKKYKIQKNVANNC
jgi:hypothetical protein